MVSAPFRFDAAAHTYTLLSTGEVRPHITGLLESGGWVDPTWYPEEASERGRAVHELTAEFDLGALRVDDCVSVYRAYLLGWVAVSGIVGPSWGHIETPAVHPELGFGGRPDRVGKVRRLASVGEVKSGGRQKGHQVQTALQAVLVAPTLRLPPESVQRVCFYVDARGRFHVELHKDRQDFDEAYRLVKKFT